MLGVGPPELILILVIALVVFGPGKLPDLGKALGTSMREFRKATDEIQGAISLESAEPKKAADSTGSVEHADKPSA